MRRLLSISFAILAVAIAGWLITFRLVPGNGRENLDFVARVNLREHRLTAGDAGMVYAPEESGVIQDSCQRAESIGKPEIPGPSALTGKASVSKGLPSSPANDSPSNRLARSFSFINQARPRTVSVERTRSKSSFARVNRDRANQVSRTTLSSHEPLSAIIPERIAPPSPKKVKTLEDSTSPIGSANPAENSESDKVPDNQVVTTPIPPQPAVWVDLGPASSLSQDKQDEIQGYAEFLRQQITGSGLDPASSEYRRVWDEAVADSDQVFRQRYGNQAWLEHHVEAYHLAHSAEEQGP